MLNLIWSILSKIQPGIALLMKYVNRKVLQEKKWIFELNTVMWAIKWSMFMFLLIQHLNEILGYDVIFDYRGIMDWMAIIIKTRRYKHYKNYAIKERNQNKIFEKFAKILIYI